MNWWEWLIVVGVLVLFAGPLIAFTLAIAVMVKDATGAIPHLWEKLRRG